MAVGIRLEIDDVGTRNDAHRQAALRYGHTSQQQAAVRDDEVGRRLGDLEPRFHRERGELVVKVSDEETDECDDDHGDEDHRPEDQALMYDRAVRLEVAAF